MGASRARWKLEVNAGPDSRLTSSEPAVTVSLRLNIFLYGIDCFSLLWDDSDDSKSNKSNVTRRVPCTAIGMVVATLCVGLM